MNTWAKLDIGFVITIIGMGVVFSVLIFLAYMFKMMELVFKHKNKKKTPATITEVLQQTAAADSSDSPALTAVITAAILSCTDDKTQLVVRSITRTGDQVPVWGKMGRQEQMVSRKIGRING